MRKYKEDNREILEKLVCNCCGKTIPLINGVEREGVCHLEIPWGYFSSMDGETHGMDLCETCYLQWIEKFQVPVTVKERTELL